MKVIAGAEYLIAAAHAHEIRAEFPDAFTAVGGNGERCRTQQ